MIVPRRRDWSTCLKNKYGGKGVPGNSSTALQHYMPPCRGITLKMESHVTTRNQLKIKQKTKTINKNDVQDNNSKKKLEKIETV